MALDVDEPKSVGADRALNAIAAQRPKGRPDRHRLRYGHDLRRRRLSTAPTRRNHRSRHQPVARRTGRAAAKLPRIAIEAPEETSVIGRTTESQMLTGVYWGYVAMIEGLVARLKARSAAGQSHRHRRACALVRTARQIVRRGGARSDDPGVELAVQTGGGALTQ